MSHFTYIKVMPTKLRYKFAVAFCLMSLLPILVGLYVASLFIHFPFEVSTANLTTISLVLGTSLLFSFLGYFITRELVFPIADVAFAAKRIAGGEWQQKIEARGSDEIEELSQSLKTISLNAHELLERVERLSQKDKLTGLFNVTYIRERLREEIERAAHFQRPCSCAYIIINGIEEYAAEYGKTASEDFLMAAASAATCDLAPFDRAAVVRKGEFFVIFPDKNKKKAIECVLRIKTALSDLRMNRGPKEPALRTKIGFSIGVSENPLDGASAEELFSRARDRALTAAAKGADSVEAF